MPESKPTLEVVLAENRSATHGQPQGTLFNVGRRLFRAVGTLLPDREYGRDIRAAVVLLDSLGTNTNETVYVGAERGYDTHPYGRVVSLRETMSQYPILTGKHQFYADAAIAEGAFTEISRDHQTASALAVPLWTPDSNVFGALCVEGISDGNGSFGQELAEPVQRIADLGALAIFYSSQATVDAVTGLYSRRKLNEELVTQYREAAMRGQPLSLIMMDVDNFKAFNDQHGHLKGDEVLRFIGTTISQHFPDRFAGRYGGEEYIVIMPTPLEDAVEHAELFRRKLERKSKEAGFSDGITASFGVASIEQIEPWMQYFGLGAVPESPRLRVGTLLDIADSAMYISKGKDVQLSETGGWIAEELGMKKNRTMYWLTDAEQARPETDVALRMVMRGKANPKQAFFRLAL